MGRLRADALRGSPQPPAWARRGRLGADVMGLAMVQEVLAERLVPETEAGRDAPEWLSETALKQSRFDTDP